MNDGCFRWVPILVPVLFGLACSSSPPPVPLEFGTVDVTAASEPTPRRPMAEAIAFPRLNELEPQVSFWRNVYSVWRRSQIVLHDDRFLDIVYEVIDLPGETAENFTPMQKEFVADRRQLWRNRLRELQQSRALDLGLEPDQRQLVSMIDEKSNGSGLAGACEHVRVQRGLRERFKRGLEISGRYDQVFRKIFRHAGLPEDLAYLPHVESSFQAAARSSAGAVGVWQFTRAAAKVYMDLDIVGDERMDPIASARGAARYLMSAYGKLGSWPLALTSYNHGLAGMQRAKNLMGDDFVRIVREYEHPKFGFASRNFYAEFLAAREIAARPEQFFPEGLTYDEPLAAEGAIAEGHPTASVVSANE